MAGVIKSHEIGQGTSVSLPIAFNVEDIQNRTKQHLDDARREAKEIIDAAKREAEAIKAAAQKQGLIEAKKNFDEQVRIAAVLVIDPHGEYDTLAQIANHPHFANNGYLPQVLINRDASRYLLKHFQC